MKNRNRTVPAFVAVALISLPLLAQAQSDQHPLLSDRFILAAGAFIHDKQFSVGVNGRAVEGEIDIDENWNLSNEETSFAGEFRWRFGEKWSVSTQYFDSSDSARAVLDKDLSWGDYVVKEGSNAGVTVDLSVARIFFGRTFSTGPNHEFGLGLGLHWLEIGAGIDAEFFLGDESTGFERKSVSADAPLPNIGAWYSYAFSSKWLARARIDWLDASIGDYDGGLWNASAGIQYQAFRNVGFALAYQIFNLNVDVDKSDWNGSVELEYSGPFLSVTANW